MHPTDDRFAAFRRHAGEISGWMRLEFLQLLAAARADQDEHHARGNILEIGVHHGRSLIPLALCRRPGERVVGVDCFDERINVSGSGRGADRRRVEANLRACGVTDVELVAADARGLGGDDYRRLGGPFRLIHVDGGHDPADALHDLVAVSEQLAPAGCLMVDDAFNEHWPAVAEAVHRWACSTTRFKPIAVGHGKALFTRADAPEYRRVQGRGPRRPWLGHSVAIWTA